MLTLNQALASDIRRILRPEIRAAVKEALPSPRAAERDRPGKSWLTNRECQDYLGLSKATLARYRAAGKLPYSRVGSSVYYRLEDVEALLEAGMTRNGAA